MHELGLCRDLVRALEIQARTLGCRRIKTVWLQLGAWAVVEEAALQFSFTLVTRATVADGAALVIGRDAGSGWCERCDAQVAVDRLDAPCPRCGAHAVRKSGGDAMMITRLEVE